MTHSTTITKGHAPPYILWSDGHQDLLVEWRTQMRLRRKGHKLQEIKYDRIYKSLGITSIVLSAMGSATIWTSFGVSTETTTIIAGALTAASTILVSVMTYLDAGSLKQKHKTSSFQYNDLSRDLDIIIRTPFKDRDEPVPTLNSVVERYDNIEKNSPSIPAEYDPGVLCSTTPRKSITPDFRGSDRPHRPNQHETLVSTPSGGFETSVPDSRRGFETSVPDSRRGFETSGPDDTHIVIAQEDKVTPSESNSALTQ